LTREVERERGWIHRGVLTVQKRAELKSQQYFRGDISCRVNGNIANGGEKGKKGDWTKRADTWNQFKEHVTSKLRRVL